MHLNGKVNFKLLTSDKGVCTLKAFFGSEEKIYPYLGFEQFAEDHLRKYGYRPLH
jgi:hypothetical protein